MTEKHQCNPEVKQEAPGPYRSPEKPDLNQ